MVRQVEVNGQIIDLDAPLEPGRGLPTFEVWTNHKPLVGIFSKNTRMQEKIMEYTPVVKWVPGKKHYYIADALSRSPMFDTNTIIPLPATTKA